jgi:hypothetical protein
MCWYNIVLCSDGNILYVSLSYFEIEVLRDIEYPKNIHIWTQNTIAFIIHILVISRSYIKNRLTNTQNLYLKFK